MEFDKDVGRLQRLMAASIAGVSRRQAILETLSIKSGDRIIDVGCGAGQLLGHLAKAVGEHGEVIGLDPSADQLAQAKSSCSDFSNGTLLEKGADLTLEWLSKNRPINSVGSDYAIVLWLNPLAQQSLCIHARTGRAWGH